MVDLNYLAILILSKLKLKLMLFSTFAGFNQRRNREEKEGRNEGGGDIKFGYITSFLKKNVQIM